MSVTRAGQLIPPGLRQPAQAVSANDASGHPTPLLVADGRPKLINFFAGWCPPCRDEVPGLETIAEEFQGRLDVIGVDTKEDRDSSLSFIRNYGIRYRVVFDPNGVVPQRLAHLAPINGLPLSVLVDSSGRIAAFYSGMVLPADLRHVIPEL
ncbi:MAG: TlpA family protein disulfide reductase [Actinobacteria bacterium]|nr:TlpA family protein disulfide reductase [Actinomycetota bacterium]